MPQSYRSEDTELLGLIAALLRDGASAPLDALGEDAAGRFCELCAIHGVEALAFAALTERPRPGSLAGLLLRRLGPVAQTHAALGLASTASVTRLLDLFAEADVPVLLLKGAALAHTLYPRPYLRARGDLDLLVPEARRGAADRLLTAAGYVRQDSMREAGSRQVSYRPPDQDLAGELIDLHWSITDAQLLHGLLAPEVLLAASVPVPALGPHARAPHRLHAMLHACMHRAANFSTRFRAAGAWHLEPDRLIWLYDIHLLSQGFDTDDWEWLCDMAADLGLRALCLDALEASARRFGSPVPARVRERLGAGPPEPSAGYLRPGLLHKLIVEVGAQRHWRGRLQVASSYALPPAEFLRDKYPERRRWPLPALYGLHLARGVLRLLGLR